MIHTENAVPQQTRGLGHVLTVPCTHPLSYGTRVPAEQLKALGPARPPVSARQLRCASLAPRSAVTLRGLTHHSAPVGQGQLPHLPAPQEGKDPIWFALCYTIFEHLQLGSCYVTISSPLMCVKQHPGP